MSDITTGTEERVPFTMASLTSDAHDERLDKMANGRPSWTDWCMVPAS